MKKLPALFFCFIACIVIIPMLSVVFWENLKSKTNAVLMFATQDCFCNKRLFLAAGFAFSQLPFINRIRF
jgi:hypothetical protein